MKRWKLVLLGAGIVIVVVTILQNTEPVQTKFLWTSFWLPRALLLFLAVLLGVLLGLFLANRLAKKKESRSEQSPAKS